MCDCTGDCDCDLTIPKGDQGDPGAPSAAFFNLFISGAPASTTSATYLTVLEFVFDAASMEVFDMLKANIYMSAGTGGLKICKKSDGSTLYENAVITATADTNIETATGLDIIPANDQIIQVQIKSNGTATCFIGSISFGYEA